MEQDDLEVVQVKENGISQEFESPVLGRQKQRETHQHPVRLRLFGSGAPGFLGRGILRPGQPSRQSTLLMSDSN